MSISIKKQTVEFIIKEYLNSVTIEIRQNDKYITSGDLYLIDDFLAEPRNKNINLKVPAGAYGIVAGCCPISRSTYDEIQAAVNQIQAKLDADPAIALQKLIDERSKLVEHYNILLTLKHEQHTQNVEDVSAYGCATKQQHDYDKDLAVADQAIKQFDTANTHVVAEIERRKQDKIKNFLATD